MKNRHFRSIFISAKTLFYGQTLPTYDLTNFSTSYYEHLGPMNLKISLHTSSFKIANAKPVFNSPAVEVPSSFVINTLQFLPLGGRGIRTPTYSSFFAFRQRRWVARFWNAISFCCEREDKRKNLGNGFKVIIIMV